MGNYHDKAHVPQVEAVLSLNMAPDVVQGVVVVAAALCLVGLCCFRYHVITQVPFLTGNECLGTNGILHPHVLFEFHCPHSPVRHQSNSKFLHGDNIVLTYLKLKIEEIYMNIE